MVRPRRGWRIARIVVALAVIAVGCADDQPGPLSAPTTSGSVSATIVAASAGPVSLDSSDPRPLVTTSNWPYGEAEWWQPKDLHDVYVYPDGTVLRIRLGDDPDAPSRVLLGEKFSVDEEAILGFLALVSEVELTGGAMLPFISLPDGVQVQDGGRTVFTARDGDEVTARVVDQLGAVSDADTTPLRAPFQRLSLELRGLEADGEAEIVEFDQWVVVSVPAPKGAVDDPADVWTGDPLDGLDWTAIGDDSRCAIVQRSSWPIGQAEQRDFQLVIDQRVITRRPLLPHEDSCVDVADWRRALEL